MKGRTTAAWILCILCVWAVGASANTELPSFTENTLVLDLPTELADLARRALDQSPQIEALKRGYEIAESKYRVGLADEQGSTINIEAPFQVDQKRRGGGAVISLRHRAGDVTAEATLGAAAAVNSSGEFRAGPTVALGVRYALTGGTSASSIRTAYQRSSAQHTYSKGMRAWTQDLVEAYGAVQLAHLDTEVAQIHLDLAHVQLNAALDRQTEGATTSAELFVARHNVTQLEAALYSAELNLDMAVDRLHRLTGLPIDAVKSDFRSVRHVLESAPEAADEEFWLVTALETRSDYALAKLAVELAEARLDEAKRAAGLNGQLQAGVTYPADQNAADPSLGWYVGAGFVLPLHDPTVSEAVYQASLELEQARADMEHLAESIASDVRLAYRRDKLATQHVSRSTAGVSHAADLAAMATDAYEAGLGTGWDVKEAELRLTEARREVVKVYFDAVLARINLWHAAGRDVAW